MQPARAISMSNFGNLFFSQRRRALRANEPDGIRLFSVPRRPHRLRLAREPPSWTPRRIANGRYLETNRRVGPGQSTSSL